VAFELAIGNLQRKNDLTLSARFLTAIEPMQLTIGHCVDYAVDLGWQAVVSGLANDRGFGDA